MVDSSGSISRRNFARMKSFLKSLVNSFDVSQSGSHVAIITYSSKPKVTLKFNDLQGSELNVAAVNEKIDRMPHMRGLTFIDKALVLAERKVFTVANGMREDKPKVIKSQVNVF